MHAVFHNAEQYGSLDMHICDCSQLNTKKYWYVMINV